MLVVQKLRLVLAVPGKPFLVEKPSGRDSSTGGWILLGLVSSPYIRFVCYFPIHSLGPVGRHQRSVFSTESHSPVWPLRVNQNFCCELICRLAVLSLNTRLPCQVSPSSSIIIIQFRKSNITFIFHDGSLSKKYLPK